MVEIMAIPDASNPIVFFKAMCRVFSFSLTKNSDSWDPIEGLSQRSYESFEDSVICKSRQGSPVACHGSCASCCDVSLAEMAETFDAIKAIAA
ncbi:hypothetical protein QEV83_00225 [Methylocapsa sp. D3K7]|uniref:hypothetical protein n=1 Tax=Methylocapsa sp. D3K7 TaxID=3041435 RepID=UPI00244EBECD|nr:hypothetical protein [Methylocapsa sp. D3K7]WGJ14788.1 hypothetical protein QEV83_00225 [Methylocapsa sp. D3K7]